MDPHQQRTPPPASIALFAQPLQALCNGGDNSVVAKVNADNHFLSFGIGARDDPNIQNPLRQPFATCGTQSPLPLPHPGQSPSRSQKNDPLARCVESSAQHAILHCSSGLTTPR